MSHYLGTLRFKAQQNRWEINAYPHVRVTLRKLFESAKHSRDHLIHIEHTPTNAMELEWILMRYPMECSQQELDILHWTAQAQRDLEQQGIDILEGRLLLDPIPLSTPLRHYQQQAFDLFRTVRGLLVADEMGLGKTAVGAAACAWAPPALVMVSTHNQIQWREQLKKFASGLRVRIAPQTRPSKLDPHDVFIVPYSKLSGWRDAVAGKYQTVVADEMQELRHDSTVRYAAASHIFGKAENRLGLTGTPIYNYGGEMHATLNLLRPGIVGTKEEFHREWCTSIGSGKWMVNEPLALRSFLTQSRAFIRRTPEDVGRELPAVIKTVHHVEYSKDILKRLRGQALQLCRKILESKDFHERGQAARTLDIKLRQATGIAKAPAVAELIADVVKDGHKVVVGVWHREVIDMLQKAMKDEKIPFWMYTGTESPDKKAAMVKGFTGHQGAGVLFLSLRSGAGLDGLQYHCNRIIYAELDWSPQVHAQFTCRVKRDGQTFQVSEVYAVIDGGSDPIISSILGLKKEQHEALVEGKQAEEVLDAQAEQARMVQFARAYIAQEAE